MIDNQSPFRKRVYTAARRAETSLAHFRRAFGVGIFDVESKLFEMSNGEKKRHCLEEES